MAINLVEKKFTFGRSKGRFKLYFQYIKNLFCLLDCNLSFPDNKMLSSNHCYIEKDDEGKIWLVDTSRNGVIINMKRKLNNNVGT